jgi:hypothetical protein
MSSTTTAKNAPSCAAMRDENERPDATTSGPS